MWVIPLLAKRSEDHIWYAVVSTSLCPIDKRGDVVVSAILVYEFWKVDPHHCILLCFKLGTYGVSLASVDAPMAVSHGNETVFDE